LNTDAYWLGLHLEGGNTEWYDGNPSIYRNFAEGEPNENTGCITYTVDGFTRTDCDVDRYFTCKRNTGIALLFLLCRLIKSSATHIYLDSNMYKDYFIYCYIYMWSTMLSKSFTDHYIKV